MTCRRVIQTFQQGIARAEEDVRTETDLAYSSRDSREAVSDSDSNNDIETQ